MPLTSFLYHYNEGLRRTRTSEAGGERQNKADGVTVKKLSKRAAHRESAAAVTQMHIHTHVHTQKPPLNLKEIQNTSHFSILTVFKACVQL